jgi:hypothetical protein
LSSDVFSSDLALAQKKEIGKVEVGTKVARTRLLQNFKSKSIEN